jgi:hypothetical protein
MLRVIGILVRAVAVAGTVTAVFALRRTPGKIRDIDLARLLTVCGLLCLGFGLAFSVGLSRVGLVSFGVLSYALSPALSVVQRRRVLELNRAFASGHGDATPLNAPA